MLYWIEYIQHYLKCFAFKPNTPVEVFMNSPNYDFAKYGDISWKINAG